MGIVRTLIDFYAFTISLSVIIVLLIFVGVKIKEPFLKQIPFHIAAVVLAFLLYEQFLAYKERQKKSTFFIGRYPKDYFEKSEVLGYGPKNNSSINVKKCGPDSIVLYNIDYHIQNHSRLTPNSDTNKNNNAVFLGCSFTFGEGLNDNETLPYYFNECSSLNYNVLNYGFHGFGPHQMLAIVETRLLNNSSLIDDTGNVAVYSYLPDHIRRAAGYSEWDQEGPLYEIEADTLRMVGKFSNKKKFILGSGFITKIWESSFIFKKHFSISVKKATDYDVLRTVKIVQKVNEVFKKLRVRFYVVVWDNIQELNLVDKHAEDYFMEQLEKSGIRYYLMSKIIPDINEVETKGNYFIKGDGHPNAYCNRKIGEYLCNEINK